MAEWPPQRLRYTAVRTMPAVSCGAIDLVERAQIGQPVRLSNLVVGKQIEVATHAGGLPRSSCNNALVKDARSRFAQHHELVRSAACRSASLRLISNVSLRAANTSHGEIAAVPIATAA
jgi:hypothetical protein